jgi:hypothetical protein
LGLAAGPGLGSVVEKTGSTVGGRWLLVLVVAGAGGGAVKSKGGEEGARMPGCQDADQDAACSQGARVPG